MEAQLAQVWRALEEQRRRGEHLDIRSLAAVLESIPGRVPFKLLDALVCRLKSVADLYLPPSVIDLMIGFAGTRRVTRALDPWCQLGQVPIAVAEAFEATDVVAMSVNAIVHRVLTRLDGNVRWELGNAATQPELWGTGNDLVISCPPFGARLSGSQSGDDELALSLLSRGVRTLVPDGQALFVLSQSCWTSPKASRWRAALNADGFAIGACIAIPSRTLAPYTNIPTVMVQVAPGTQGDLFAGELPSSGDAQRLLLENYKGRRDSRDARLGRWVDATTFVTLTQLLAAETVEKLGRRAGTRIVLGDCATITKWGPGRDVAPTAVLVPAEGPATRPALLATTAQQARGRYFAIDAREDVAVPDFLVHYFNSDLGRLTREAAAIEALVPRVSMDALRSMPVFLPSKPDQLAAISTAVRIQALVCELRELEERVWTSPRSLRQTQAAVAKVNHEDRFEVWIDTLPFPLATVLWLYATRRSAKEKTETLFHFFEAYAALWATTLLSVFLRLPSEREDWKQRVQQVLRERRQRLEHAGFGTWIAIVELLSKAGREFLADRDRQHLIRRRAAVSSTEFLEVLFSKEILQVLVATNTLRNSWKGHGGVVSDETAAEQLETLEGHLGRLRAIVGERWELYTLCRMGHFEVRNGVFVAQVERVVGTRTPFPVDTLELASPAESGCLHFVGVGSNEALPLLPFVKVMPSPKTALNACYFYNRTEKEGVRFVSYHFAEDAECVGRFDDTAREVASLSDVSLSER